MSKNPLVGLRYVNLLRCSTNMQDTSTSDQKTVNDRHAEKLGMIHAGDITLNGVSGSKSFNRRDLVALLERRRVFKNYDVIVVYDSSRLTRAGARHAFSIRRDFAKEGVIILSVMDPIPDGDFKEVIQSVIDTQNFLAAKKISGFVTRGVYDAVKNGTVEKHGAVPIGIDRQYLGSDGHPTLRLRYLTGGIRQLIDEASGKVIKQFVRGEQPTAAYLMNRGEKVRLVAGDAKTASLIADAFRLRYRENWGFSRIARYFAEQGLRPTRAAAWRDTSIRDIVMNPTYLGWSYFLQLKCGLHHVANADRPQERTDVNQDELEKLGRTEVPRVRRPLAEMLKVQHPMLTDFISDQDVKEEASKAIEEYFSTWHLSVMKEPLQASESQPTSRYFLRNVIRDRHFRRKFCGVTHGRNGAYRDYVCSRLHAMPDQIAPTRTSIRAQPLEQAVLQVLKYAFGDIQCLKAQIEEMVGRAKAELPDERERARLTEELAETKNRMSQLQRLFTASELAENITYVNELRNQRMRIEQRLAEARASDNVDATAVVGDVVNALNDLGSAIDGEGFEKLRLLVNTICREVTVDLVTMEVVVHVALPRSILTSSKANWRMMSVPSAQEDSNRGITHRDSWLPLGFYRLTPTFNPPPCNGRNPSVACYAWEPIVQTPLAA